MIKESREQVSASEATRRLTFNNNNNSKESISSNESSHMKAEAEAAAIVGASSEVGEQEHQ